MGSWAPSLVIGNLQLTGLKASADRLVALRSNALNDAKRKGLEYEAIASPMV